MHGRSAYRLPSYTSLRPPTTSRLESYSICLPHTEIRIPLTVGTHPGIVGERMVLFCYGGSLTCRREDVDLLAAHFRNGHFSTAVFDFRGTRSEPEVPAAETGLTTRIEDARAVVQFLLDRYSPRSLAIVGISMGGYIATHLLDFNPRCLILIAPAAYHPRAVEEKIMFGPAFTACLRDSAYPWSASDAFDRIHAYTGSTLIVGYEHEDIIPAGVLEKYVHSAGTRDKVLRVLPNLAHKGTFEETSQGEAKRRTIAQTCLPWLSAT